MPVSADPFPPELPPAATARRPEIPGRPGAVDGSLRRPARIRHLARDGVLVASFSLATSISATLLLGLLTWWLR